MLTSTHQRPSETGLVGGHGLVTMIIECGQVEVAGVVFVGSYKQQHPVKGHAVLRDVMVLILIPPHADKLLFQDSNGYRVAVARGGHSQQEYSKCKCG